MYSDFSPNTLVLLISGSRSAPATPNPEFSWDIWGAVCGPALQAEPLLSFKIKNAFLHQRKHRKIKNR